tara:strand:+ start:319 stop:528 length:210 start_codon:yes stop_codon:yes gene_type:complete
MKIEDRLKFKEARFILQFSASELKVIVELMSSGHSNVNWNWIDKELKGKDKIDYLYNKLTLNGKLNFDE